jgi:hypothetical protein
MTSFTYLPEQSLTIVYANKPTLNRDIDVVSDHEDHIIVNDHGLNKKFLKSRILSVLPRINFEKVYESISDEEAIECIDDIENKIRLNIYNNISDEEVIMMVDDMENKIKNISL